MQYKTKNDNGLINRVYWSTRQVAEMFEIKTSELRYWEDQFHDLCPRRKTNGNRMYDIHDIKVVRRIYNLLNTEKFTIEGAKKRLLEIKVGVI